MITEEDLKYDFAILIPGSNFHKDFVTSLMDTLVWLMQNNYTFIYRVWSSSILPDLRNALLGAEDVKSRKISKTLFNGKYSAKKIIMIDSDMCWEIEDFAAIALSNHDVTTGLVTIGENKYAIAKRVIGEEPWGYYLPYKYYEVTESLPFEVDATGTAFLSINSEVFSNIDMPWFEFSQTFLENSDYQPRMIGEDYLFSEKIKKAGYKIYADPRVKPGHLKTEAKY